LLSDFGIAHSNEFDSRLTMTGSAIGTPAYMAPEQIDGAPANARSDLYSLGLLTWEMLTGERPWAGDALYNVIYKQKHEELPAIDSLRPGAVPARLQYIVERMLQKRPGARWAGADGLLAALNAWVVPSDWRQWEESHKRRREREKANPRPVAARNEAGEDATVRFARPMAGVTPELMKEAAVTPPRSVTPQPVEAVDEDAAPSWATDVAPATGRRRRWLVGVSLALALAGGAAYAMYAGKLAPFARTASSATMMNDQATVELPIVSTGAPIVDSAAALAADSAMIANGALLRDSLAVAQRLSDSVRIDSMMAAARRAERRAARLAAGAATPVVPGPAASAPVAAPPAAPAAPTASVRSTDDPGVVAAGGRHSCALVSSRVLCWGANDRGQLGDGDAEGRGTPAPIVGDLDFVQVTTGLSHSCGVVRGGDAYCWGADDRGQLGDATFTSRSAPVRVSGNQNFRVLRAGQNHTCGLTTGGDVLCWGANGNGQLGDGGSANRSSPVAVGGGLKFVSLAAGWNHSCGVAFDGTAYCWGANAAGQLGNGARTDTRTPTAVSSELRFTSIAAGATHSCAVSDSGDAFCWGRNNYGQLGTGGTGDQAVPAPVYGSTKFASVTVGGVHSCARTRSGQVFCWGRNVYGQLGDGSNSTHDMPTRVAGGVSFSAVHASGAHTCATSGDDGLWCWGFNVEGQLGDGSRNHLSRPTRVVLPSR
jgi:alpha-tubulin suppressor-like RCC1 family protein